MAEIAYQNLDDQVNNMNMGLPEIKPHSNVTSYHQTMHDDNTHGNIQSASSENSFPIDNQATIGAILTTSPEIRDLAGSMHGVMLLTTAVAMARYTGGHSHSTGNTIVLLVTIMFKLYYKKEPALIERAVETISLDLTNSLLKMLVFNLVFLSTPSWFHLGVYTLVAHQSERRYDWALTCSTSAASCIFIMPLVLLTIGNLPIGLDEWKICYKDSAWWSLATRVFSTLGSFFLRSSVGAWYSISLYMLRSGADSCKESNQMLLESMEDQDMYTFGEFLDYNFNVDNWNIVRQNSATATKWSMSADDDEEEGVQTYCSMATLTTSESWEEVNNDADINDANLDAITRGYFVDSLELMRF
jgi:hypothetical protein